MDWVESIRTILKNRGQLFYALFVDRDPTFFVGLCALLEEEMFALVDPDQQVILLLSVELFLRILILNRVYCITVRGEILTQLVFTL